MLDYHDPSVGYWSRAKMIQKNKKKYVDYLNKLESIQRHREIKAPQLRKQFRHETAPYPFYSVQIDLAFLPKLKSPVNKNMIGFIVVIDVFSRFLWVQPIKNRKSLHIQLEPILQEMKDEFNKTPENMTGDNEFATTQLQHLAGKFDFKWWFGDAHEKFRTGISERVIRTIKNLIKRYLTQNNTIKYIDVLDKFVENYNTTFHRTIRTEPRTAITTGKTLIKKYPNEITIKKLNVGDKVRVLLRRTALTKGDEPYYSKVIYEIEGKDKNRFVVSKDGEIMAKRYGQHQLLKIPDDTILGQQQNQQENVPDYERGRRNISTFNSVQRSLQREGMRLTVEDRAQLQSQIDIPDEAIPEEEAKKNPPEPRRSNRLRIRELPVQTINCPQDHELKSKTLKELMEINEEQYDEGYWCDICDKHIKKGKAHHCGRCNYDICDKCFDKKVKEKQEEEDNPILKSNMEIERRQQADIQRQTDRGELPAGVPPHRDEEDEEDDDDVIQEGETLGGRRLIAPGNNDEDDYKMDDIDEDEDSDDKHKEWARIRKVRLKARRRRRLKGKIKRIH